MAAGSQRDENCADRFVRRAAVGTGDSSHRKRVVRAGRAPRALGHFPSDRFADGAVRSQRFGPNTQKGVLRLVAVCHQPGQQHGGRAGDVGDPVRDGAAGARFSQGECPFPVGQQANDNRLELVVVHAKNVRAEELAHNILGLFHDFLRRGAAGCESDIHFADARAVADFETGVAEVS